mmetsp:Transcript_10375/g.21024  ORF Transcript_10375/g.21024 Transcript_10375/m.21024 type:complete len:331 (-) Transcript_10375:298-1290(-)
MQRICTVLASRQIPIHLLPPLPRIDPDHQIPLPHPIPHHDLTRHPPPGLLLQNLPLRVLHGTQQRRRRRSLSPPDPHRASGTRPIGPAIPPPPAVEPPRQRIVQFDPPRQHGPSQILPREESEGRVRFVRRGGIAKRDVDSGLASNPLDGEEELFGGRGGRGEGGESGDRGVVSQAFRREVDSLFDGLQRRRFVGMRRRRGRRRRLPERQRRPDDGIPLRDPHSLRVPPRQHLLHDGDARAVLPPPGDLSEHQPQSSLALHGESKGVDEVLSTVSGGEEYSAGLEGVGGGEEGGPFGEGGGEGDVVGVHVDGGGADGRVGLVAVEVVVAE